LVAGYPHKKLLEFILSYASVNINQQDYLKRTPLHAFIDNSHEKLGYTQNSVDLLEVLLNHKADPNIADIKKEYPALQSVTLDKFYFLGALGKAGAKLDIANDAGLSPLIVCVQKGKLDNAEALLEAGANPNFKDHMGRTALHHAINSSSSSADASFEMESLLLKHKADPNIRDERGRVPLHYAFVKIG